MKVKEIYDILRAGGLSHAGALGVIGNMMAEAGPSLPSNIAQRGMTTLSDAEYTRLADAGQIDFVHDAIGYGLCQWTYHSRKQGLLNYARQQGVSVGNGTMQCQYALKELREEYGGIYGVLCNSTSIDDCADVVCTQFERPAINNLAVRRQFAHEAEREIGEGNSVSAYTPPIKDPIQATFPPDPSVFILQMVMQYNGYWDERPDGHKSKAFFDELERFVRDVENC